MCTSRDSVSPHHHQWWFGAVPSTGGCWRAPGAPLHRPGRQSGPRGPFKSSRPSSGRGRDYSSLSRMDSSGTVADERNAPPRARPAGLCPPQAPAGPDAVSSAALELWLLPGEAGTKPHQTLSREASGPVAQLSPFPASVSSSVAWARPPGCSWVIWGSTGAVWAEAAGGQTPSLSCRSFPRGARPGPLASPSTEPLSRKFEVAGRTDLLEA